MNHVSWNHLQIYGIGLLFCILFNGFIVYGQVETAPWTEQRLFERAQCKAFCLRLFGDPTEQEHFRTPWDHINERRADWINCFQRDAKQCNTSCFTACDIPPADCVEHCSNKNIGCYFGCKFSSEIVQTNGGRCPNPIPIMMIPNSDINVCPSACQTNQDCQNPNHVCCVIGCQRKCVEPMINESVAPSPTVLNFSESDTNRNMIHLMWDSNYKHVVSVKNPIVFILQLRICICKQLIDSYASKWQTLIMTPGFGAKLDAFEPGRMYQFRVAAVNVHGTLGFGPASDPYPSTPIPPKVPDPPRNLTDSMWRLYSNGKMSVLLSWEAPIHTDIPVTEYLVTWVVDHGYLQPDGQSLEALTQFTQSVPIDRKQCIIRNLKAGTSYKVKVKAISYWYGHGPLESQANTLFLSTQSIHPAFQLESQKETLTNDYSAFKRLSENEKSGCGCSMDSGLLTLQKLSYNKNQLTATFTINLPTKDSIYLVEWSPQVCIDSNEPTPYSTDQTMQLVPKEPVLTLNGLHFNCRYGVRIRIMNKKKLANLKLTNSLDSTTTTGSRYYGCFCTPSCFELQHMDDSLSDRCPQPVPEPPSPPSRLKVTNIGDLDYQISWEAQNTSERQTRNVNKRKTSSIPKRQSTFVTKYRVIWAPRMNEPVEGDMYNDEAGFSPIMDLQQSDVRVLDKDQNRLSVKNLKPNTFYIVRVQTLLISKDGLEKESSPTSVYFVTSGLKNQNQVKQETGQTGSLSSAQNSPTCNTILTHLLTVLVGLGFPNHVVF